ncbi:unnamed protein product, partial [Discosporangium mesarthrocarpum]
GEGLGLGLGLGLEVGEGRAGASKAAGAKEILAPAEREEMLGHHNSGGEQAKEEVGRPGGNQGGQVPVAALAETETVLADGEIQSLAVVGGDDTAAVTAVVAVTGGEKGSLSLGYASAGSLERGQ